MQGASPKLIPELKVTNFDKSLDFYTQLCGFEIHYARPEEKFAMLEKDGAMLMIELMESQDRWKVGKRVHPLGQGVNFQIQVSSAQKLHDLFTDAGYPVFFEMEEKWYRKNDQEVGNKQFLVQDPDGYLLRFFEDLGTRESE